jgi:hypothetical protein
MFAGDLGIFLKNSVFQCYLFLGAFFTIEHSLRSEVSMYNKSGYLDTGTHTDLF